MDPSFFWDEPEANLNPALLGLVVDVLLRLQRMGVQVFLATHNYVLLKEFDLRSREQDQIRYLSLFRDEMGAVQTLASDDLSGVDPNLIIDTYTSLYDREITWNRYMKNMPVTRLVAGQAAPQGQGPAQSRPA